MIVKILAAVAAVAGAASLTLATMIALVEGTIMAVSIADLVLGTFLLVACIYVATHLTVEIVGVGNAEFPPLPDELPPTDAPKSF